MGRILRVGGMAEVVQSDAVDHVLIPLRSVGKIPFCQHRFSLLETRFTWNPKKQAQISQQREKNSLSGLDREFFKRQ